MVDLHWGWSATNISTPSNCQDIYLNYKENLDEHISHSKYVSLRLCKTYMHHCEVSALWEYQTKKKFLDGIHQGLSKHQFVPPL